MTYVVTEACIKCKYTDCVEVCPVDCFYEGDNMLVIHPDECIDCGVCEPQRPADAIKPDTEPGLEKWLEVNTEYAKSWPNITQKRIPRPTPRISRVWKANSRNIFLLRRVPATDFSSSRWLNARERVSDFARWLNPNPRDGAEGPPRGHGSGHKSLIFAENVLY